MRALHGIFAAAALAACCALSLGCASPPARDAPVEFPRSAEPETPSLAAPEPAPVPANTAGLEEARLLAARLTKSDSLGDYASPAVFANFREIRLGAIPPRRLYRSSHPALPGDPRFPYAQQFAENARIRAVINLVDDAGRIALYAEHNPWYRSFISGGRIIGLELGADYHSPAFEAGLGAALRFIIGHEGPYLIHDNDGRDRTGFLAALLEALMGASPGEVAADYLKSYENYYRLEPSDESYRTLAVIAEDVLFTITGYLAPEAVDLAAEAEAYLRERMGLSPEEIAALKARLGA